MDTFTALRVTFDSNIAIRIINRELGVAKKLLYELKTVLRGPFSSWRRPTTTRSAKPTV